VFFGVDQTFTWAEIAAVTRPPFGIPYDVAHIITMEGKKLTVARSMTGFPELLRLIETKAPNLTPKQLPENLWPPTPVKAWRQMLIAFGLFIAYIVVKKFLGW
jgi:hypothetical protein